MTMIKIALRATCAAAALVAAPQARAVTFVLNSSINTSTMAGLSAQRDFQVAAAYWSSVLRDNFTVRLNIGFSSLGADILGQTGSSTRGLFVSNVYSALTADRTSLLDVSAVANLSPLTTSAEYGAPYLGVTAITNDFNADGTGYVDTATRIDNDGSANNLVLDVNNANAKALGFADTGAVDGSVTFSSDFAFDFDASDGIAANQSDFLGVAIHEIGHALGFVSGVDTYDFFTAPGDPDPIVRDENGDPIVGALEEFRVSTVLDLYRYSSAGNLDWSTQNTPYFSVNGGVSQVYGNSLFSTGEENGDGWQASHWKAPTNSSGQFVCGAYIGIMNPYFCDGQTGVVTSRDLAAFDAIGYNLSASARDNAAYSATTAQIYRQFAPTPEPATWAMMIMGFGVIGGSMRAQRRRIGVRFV